MICTKIESLPKRLPEHIPALAEALTKALKEGDDSLLNKRAAALHRMQIPIGFLKYAFGLGHPVFGVGPSLPVAILEHELSSSAAQKAGILLRERQSLACQLNTEQMPEPLKTVTLGFKTEGIYAAVLVTGVGDFEINQQIKRKIAGPFQLSNSVADRAVINPEGIDPASLVGLIPGVVGPFVNGKFDNSRLWAVVFLNKHPAADKFVAVAVSPWETMVVDQAVFRVSLNWWDERNGWRRRHKNDSIGVEFYARVTRG